MLNEIPFVLLNISNCRAFTETCFRPPYRGLIASKPYLLCSQDSQILEQIPLPHSPKSLSCQKFSSHMTRTLIFKFIFLIFIINNGFPSRAISELVIITSTFKSKFWIYSRQSAGDIVLYTSHPLSHNIPANVLEECLRLVKLAPRRASVIPLEQFTSF